MYGSGEEFSYNECASCGSLQIAKVPAHLAEFYPQDYYSFDNIIEESPLKQFLIRRRSQYLAGQLSPVGWLYSQLTPAPSSPSWFPHKAVQFDDAILDVGCGAGAYLTQLGYMGFSKLTGIDPFIKQDRRFSNGISILKRSLEEADGKYSFIMLHHSLEHMSDQESAMEHLYRLLLPLGRVLIRIPVAGTFAWQKYRTDWAQLDAPRHLNVHTEAGLKALAKRTGFEVERVVYDSTGFQFWGSEQIKRGLPLIDKATGVIEPRADVFTKDELIAFEQQAETLNKTGQGDQACFYLRKA